ncbi:Magnesium transporter mgtE [uncultured Flavonifractor sp.]|jgi:magnesium transporter|uniref:Magnesium transporter MgtE n=1 Tax=Flintibacter hominis TaxID=2763048 RepID=A0A8J6J3M1_9FIRM|nr:MULTISPECIES: magnesium transporter [Eubacteriales]SCH78859.1 Magnesium transporter mgtE [uncultured Clostridium sp.]SCI85864.1 Magnesium transporter mgtE [uncultured Flavonifractor sp.]MBC5723694.1 magnesium transporter [Flintibacter hominis]MCH1978607.1 magnesium transporter [Lawsonibacter sp. OA9]MCU6704188.1 magnesium transporter [Muriventricola aceti]
MHENYDLELLMELVRQKKFRQLKEALGQMNEVDIAEFLDELDVEQEILVFRLLPKDLAAEVFTYLENTEDQEKLIGALSDKELREVLDELFLDDTVDIIEDMPANVVSRILRNTDTSTRSQINQLLNYPKDSAGSIMTTEFVYLHPDATVEQSFARIRRVGLDKETVYTCYVTQNRVLLGVVTVKTMLLSAYETRIGDIMETNVLSVTTHEDKEDVAQMFSKYGLTALPVVDGEDRLVGIITVDDAMDVIEEETTEDFEKMAAILPSDKPYLRTGVFETWKSRIPWLMLLMLSATFTGIIITSFESALNACVILTSFIPMLSGTGGNSGSQSSVAVIRALSLDEVEFSDVLAVLWKEIRVAVLCGVCLGGANFIKMMVVDRWLMHNPEVTPLVALVVCLTLMLTVVCAKIVGCTLPMAAEKVGIDPAVMAAPFITTIVDALSLLIYFAIATHVLGI